MTFILFLLVNATLFLRPAEIVPQLVGVPIYEFLMISCTLGAFTQLRQQLDWQRLAKQPATLCVLGVLVAAVLSHVMHFYAYGARESGIIFLKTVLYYLLLVSIVNTPQRLRWFLLTVTISATLMVALCVIDYLGIVDFTFVTHVSDWDDEINDSGDLGRILRMRGTGIFQDPNDLSMVIVAISVLCFYFLTDRTNGSVRHVPIRAMWLVPMGLLFLALLFTRSRGGMLAGGAAGFTLFLFHYGKKPAITLALLGVCIVPLVAGRQSNMELSGGTGQDRIQLWNEGFAAIKSPDVLFGIGMNEYAELMGLVAHNSFVHAYVELGFFGGTLFLGCFFFPAVALYRLWRVQPMNPNNEFERFQAFLAAILAGWGVSMLSLSRCYVAPTYLVFGLATAYLNIAVRQFELSQPLVVWDRRHIMKLVTSSGMLFVGLVIISRVFARWS